ncbi:High-affinity copper transporter ctrA2 [Paecilomyces lecythidis]
MDMSSMNMSGSSSMSSSSMSSMPMVFTNTHTMPLYSTMWTPKSQGGYAGTCIFLIILAIIVRSLIAIKAIMEQRWLAAHLQRRYIVVAGKNPEAGRISSDPEAKMATLVSAQGVEESVRVVHRYTQEPLPWRFSVDLPRALLVLCIAGVGYLLMLGVMTMNVGYFCSVLAGIFLGELGVGRYIQYNHWNEH